VLLHVIDAGHPGWEEQMRVVDQVLGDIGIVDRPLLPVFNKMDTVADPAAFTGRVRELYPDALLASTLRLEGLEAVKEELRRRERQLRPPVTVLVPLADGARLASLYRMGEVIHQTVDGGHHAVSVRLMPWQVAQLRQEGLEVISSAMEERRAG